MWLGSNYPAPGEYNQDNDPESLRYVLSTDVPFEMVLVRYGMPSGTDAIRVGLPVLLYLDVRRADLVEGGTPVPEYERKPAE